MYDKKKRRLAYLLIYASQMMQTLAHEKKTEKLSMYKDLELKVSRMWKVRTKIVKVNQSH